MVGGGIVGLATAYALVRRKPGLRVVVLEKEPDVARHQTGRNSGVIHSGIYYRPGSVKAATCREGKARLEQFCEREGLPWERCGKVIVATRPAEIPRLDDLMSRGQANGVECRRIDRARLAELEPCAAGLDAIYVTETGIVDYVAVCLRLTALIREAGGEVVTGARVFGLVERGGEVTAQTTAGDVTGSFLVNCAGLHSDRVARMAGARPTARILPVRGEYFALRPEAWRLCRNLIYPVPDPSFPFLGVHLTRVVSGGVECGPNAVLALGREAYAKASFRPADLAEMALTLGFWRLGAGIWRTAASEAWRSLSRRAFAQSLRRLVPELNVHDLIPAEPGIRAQAVGPDGRLIDDFEFLQTPRALHVLNAPSPAATAAFSIGERLADRCPL